MKKAMLLVSEDMCEILRAALDDKYITLPCSDPAAGRKMLEQKPNVLILDLFLPDTDGVAFLKAHAADLPPVILAITRFISDDLLQELEALGVSSVTLIPCNPSYLRGQFTKP